MTEHRREKREQVFLVTWQGAEMLANVQPAGKSATCQINPELPKVTPTRGHMQQSPEKFTQQASNRVWRREQATWHIFLVWIS